MKNDGMRWIFLNGRPGASEYKSQQQHLVTSRYLAHRGDLLKCIFDECPRFMQGSEAKQAILSSESRYQYPALMPQLIWMVRKMLYIVAKNRDILPSRGRQNASLGSAMRGAAVRRRQESQRNSDGTSTEASDTHVMSKLKNSLNATPSSSAAA